MTTTARQDLERKLQDPEYKKYFGAAEAKSELAIALSYARHDLEMTQEEMASKLGVSQPYIAKLESGEANPTIGTVGMMLAALCLRIKMATAPLLSSPGIVGSGNATMAWSWPRPFAAVAANPDVVVTYYVDPSFRYSTQSYKQVKLFKINSYDELTLRPSGEVNTGVLKESGVLVGGSN